MSVMEFRLEDVLRLRKPHPCGGDEWTVYRLGADIGLRCNTCGHRLLVPRSRLEKRVREVRRRGPALPPQGAGGGHG